MRPQARYGAPVPEIGRDLADALIEVVRERMTEQGMSGRALADRLSMSTSTLARHLRGETDLTVDQYDAIAVALSMNGLQDLVEYGRRRL